MQNLDQNEAKLGGQRRLRCIVGAASVGARRWRIIAIYPFLSCSCGDFVRFFLPTVIVMTSARSGSSGNQPEVVR